MIRDQDFEAYTQIGHSLWADHDRSRRAMVEALSAASLQDLTEERVLEKATTALLQRATYGKLAATPGDNASAISNPFFRLSPGERLILSALHRGRWSYARLGRVLNVTAEQIEEMAWIARVNLATAAKSSGILPKISYPAGARPAGASCPEYDSAHPWTQRFLDEEFAAGAQRIYFQNHLMACDSCRAALSRCRDLYYAIETLIPSRTHVRGGLEAPKPDLEQSWIDHLRSICDRSNKVRHPVEFTWRETMQVFVRHREVQVGLCVLAVLIALKVSSLLGAIHI